MQSCEDIRRFGDRDAARAEACAYFLIVEELREKSCIHFTGMATARTAIESCCERIVDSLAAMAGKKKQTRKPSC